VRAATDRHRATLARYRDAIAGLAIIDERAEALADAIDATVAEPPALATVVHLYQLVYEIEPPAAEATR
jgi:hypothetical protein